jgi:hypothetical protein
MLRCIVACIVKGKRITRHFIGVPFRRFYCLLDWHLFSHFIVYVDGMCILKYFPLCLLSQYLKFLFLKTLKLSFQEWTQQVQEMLNTKKFGDIAFRDKDFKTAIDYYSKVP